MIVFLSEAKKLSFEYNPNSDISLFKFFQIGKISLCYTWHDVPLMALCMRRAEIFCACYYATTPICVVDFIYFWNIELNFFFNIGFEIWRIQK